MIGSLRQIAAGAGALALALLTAAPPALAQPAAPALWRITDADSTVWVFGSVHVLKPDTDWRRPELERALEAAEIVYFEAPVDFFSQAQVQPLVVELGFNPPGVSLSDWLTPDDASRLARVAEGLGANPEEFETMRPWLAATVLTTLMTDADGATVGAGVDSILAYDARRAGKELRFFETLEDGVRFFAEMPNEVQIAFLVETLVQYEANPTGFDALVDAWVQGDLAMLEALVVDSIKTSPEIVYDTLFLLRNRAWAEELDAFMSGSGDALVVVGAGHMVGPDSLILMMEARGYETERY